MLKTENEMKLDGDASNSLFHFQYRHVFEKSFLFGTYTNESPPYPYHSFPPIIFILYSHIHRLVRRDAVELIVRRSKMGDWFLLFMLGENIDTIIFRDIMQDLATRLGHNQHHRVPGIKGEIQDA